MASIIDIVSYFNSAKQQAIVWHQEVKGPGSFAAHKALEEFYEEIVDLLDGLSESYAGIYGRLSGYEVHDLVDFTSIDDIIKYYRGCYEWLQTERKTAPQDSYIQNQLDEITQLLGSTLYKLTLK
jgi:DNA-binding ferritin-like protein